MQLLDFSKDDWADAKLDEVEEWLSGHLANRSGSQAADIWKTFAWPLTLVNKADNWLPSNAWS